MGIRANMDSFMANSKHILHVSYKPDSATFNTSAKVILLGILTIGALGFIISLIVQFITGSTV